MQLFSFSIRLLTFAPLTYLDYQQNSQSTRCSSVNKLTCLFLQDSNFLDTKHSFLPKKKELEHKKIPKLNRIFCRFNFGILFCSSRLLGVSIHAVEIFKSLFQSGYKGFFSFTQPYSRIIVLLIRLILTIWIAYLTLQIS